MSDIHLMDTVYVAVSGDSSTFSRELHRIIQLLQSCLPFSPMFIEPILLDVFLWRYFPGSPLG